MSDTCTAREKHLRGLWATQVWLGRYVFMVKSDIVGADFALFAIVERNSAYSFHAFICELIRW